MLLTLLIASACSRPGTDPVRRAAILGCIEVAENELYVPSEKALKLKEAGCREFSSREIQSAMPAYRKLQEESAIANAEWEAKLRMRSAQAAVQEEERMAQAAVQEEERAAQQRATERASKLRMCLFQFNLQEAFRKFQDKNRAPTVIPECLQFSRDEIATAQAEEALKKEIENEQYQDIMGIGPQR